jgi:hypothetical protein
MDFAHRIRQSAPQPAADDKEEVHSSGNKEEMATDVEDSARTGKAKWLPRNVVVEENLVVVAGNLFIPAVSKLNTVRS